MSPANAVAGVGAAATVTLLHHGLGLRRRAAMASGRRGTRGQGTRRLAPRLGPRLADLHTATVEHRLALALPCVLVLAVVGGGVLPAAVVGGVIVVGPSVVERISRWRREQVVENAMPPLLDEMARGMRAGLSASTAFLEAVRVAPTPMVAAASGIADRLRSGDDLVRASSAWASERPVASTALLATAISVGAAVGGVHARTIDAVAATLRERHGTAAELATQALQARLSALVMTVAPIVFCSFLVLSDPRASHFLLRTPVGIACALIGLSLDALAAFWMSRIARGAQS